MYFIVSCMLVFVVLDLVLFWCDSFFLPVDSVINEPFDPFPFSGGC